MNNIIKQWCLYVYILIAT